MIDTKALRKRIIDLAVSGKLNECTNKSASEELKRIISDLGNSKQREILDEEKWTDIPSNWTWTRLADLTTNDTLNDGNWVLSEDMVPDGEVKLIQLGSIGDCEYRFKGFKYLTEKHFKELNGRQIYPGYLLINRLVVDKMLSCIIPDIKGILITAVDVCWVAPNENYYSIDYLMYVMSSSGIQQRVQELGHGVTRFRISKLNLIDIAFPMPPLDEQRMIVNTINELYSILNKIDNLQAKYSNDLAVLKSKIIDAGIQGKLTERLPEDGDAETLYAQIQKEKEKLIKEGKIKKEKPLADITADEIPFEIPKNWKWVRIANVGLTATGTTPPKGNKEYYGGNYPFFKPSDLDVGRHISIGSESLTDDGWNVSRQLRKGSILVCCIGTIGKSAIIDVDGTTNQQINAITPILCDSDYILYAIDSDSFQKQLQQGSRATTVTIIKKSKFDECIIPLPTLSEQKRVSERINELLSMMELIEK